MATEDRARNRRVLASAQQPELNQLSSGSSSENDSESDSDARFTRKRAPPNSKGARAKDAAGRKDAAASNEVASAAGPKARPKTAGASNAAPSSAASRPEWSAPQMSAEELASHYDQCIKLSATNKINAKNAFSLHLIEFMSELLRKDVNFQVASSTLHAGAKIYASRVDAVHKNTMRVRSGLSGNPQDGASSSSSEDDEQNVDVDGENGAPPKSARNKPKRKKKKVVLSSSEAQRIRQKRPEAHLQIDPLFRLHAAEFNEAGVEALFANRYDFSDTQPFACFSNDANAIVMHTSDSWRTTLRRNYRNLRVADTDTQQEQEQVQQKEDESNEQLVQFQLPVSVFRDSLSAAMGDDSHVCPHFRTFEFNARDSQLDFVDRLLHTDADTEQERERAPANEQFDWLNDDPDRYRALPPPARADDSDDAMPDAGYTSPGSDDERSHLVGMAAEHIENTPGQSMAQLVATMIREGNTTSLSRILADKPSDFTFFDSSMLRLWAGPSHWRTRNPFGKLPVEGNEPAATKKKEAAATSGSKNRRIDFFVDPSTFAAMFKKSRTTTLSEAALSKQEHASTTLPEYAHFEPRMLTCAFLKAAHRFDRSAPHGDVDETLVPTGAAPGVDNSDDDHVPAADGSLPDDDAFNAYDGSMIQSDGHNWLLVDGADDEGRQNVVRAVELDRILDSQPQSQVPGASSATGADPQANLNQTLVAAPQRVAKMDINYTRVARHVDVPCVKKALWFLIRRNAKTQTQTQAPSGDAPPPPTARSNALDSRTAACEPGRSEPNNNKQAVFSCTFADLISQLPSCVPAKVTESLNSPIIFVCLLHLTNEKSLYLRKQDDLGNFDILLEPDAETGAAHEQSRVRSPRGAARRTATPVGGGRVGRVANKHARQALAAQADAELSSEGESPETVKKKRVVAV